MKKTWIVIGVIVVLVLLVGGWLWSSYNGLIVMKEDATAQWQQVETVYQRRFDLIPNVVAAVQGVMNQETEIFTALADARSRYAGASTPSDKAAAASQVETSFGRLLAIMENYPTLKSSDAVRDLNVQLEGTENRIATERQRYNEKVQAYEVAIKRFPGSLIAGMFGFDHMEYFEADEGAEKAPQVKFE